MSDTMFYLNNLRHRTHDITLQWMALAKTLSTAYDNAYHNQLSVLQEVKRKQELARRQEEEMISLMLNLLSVGIVGTVAGCAVKSFKWSLAGPKLLEAGKVPVNKLKDVAGYIAEDGFLAEWTGNAFSALAGIGADKLKEFGIDKIKPSGPPEDPFKPPGVRPSIYANDLELGILRRAIAMAEIAHMMYWELRSVPPKLAEAAHDAFLSSSFFTELPGGVLDHKELERSAELVLWITWGKARDLPYWKEQHDIARKDLVSENRRLSGPPPRLWPLPAPDPNVVEEWESEYYLTSESWSWAPLFTTLQKLRVPMAPLTLTRETYAYDRVVLGSTRAKRRLTGKKITTINFPGFIAWAKSAAALQTAFDEIPKHAKWYPAARQRLLAALGK